MHLFSSLVFPVDTSSFGERRRRRRERRRRIPKSKSNKQTRRSSIQQSSTNLYIERSSNSASNSNELNMSRFELTMGIIVNSTNVVRSDGSSRSRHSTFDVAAVVFWGDFCCDAIVLFFAWRMTLFILYSHAIVAAAAAAAGIGALEGESLFEGRGHGW